jgi:hypothetical protein
MVRAGSASDTRETRQSLTIMVKGELTEAGKASLKLLGAVGQHRQGFERNIALLRLCSVAD